MLSAVTLQSDVNQGVWCFADCVTNWLSVSALVELDTSFYLLALAVFPLSPLLVLLFSCSAAVVDTFFPQLYKEFGLSKCW